MIRLFKVAMSENAKIEVGKVLDSGYIGEGPKVKEFEAKLEGVLGHKVLAVNSCTSAIDLALHLCDVGSGAEVIVTPMTCSATVTMLANRKAKIVWADVDPNTGLISPDDVAHKITRFTKTIIAVDWGGSICDFEQLRRSTCGLPVIEDAAHAFKVDPHVVRGDYICYSHQAIKFLTTGDGGSLRVPANQYKRAKLLRWFGLDRDQGESFRCAQTIDEAGYKYHMNDIAAAIGLANIDLALANVEKHKANARYYDWRFNKHTRSNAVPPYSFETPSHDPDSSYWLYTILVDNRDGDNGFIAKMNAKGVECSPVHARCDKHPAFRGYSGAGLPGLDHFASREVAIPVGWWLTEAEREHVANSVLECV